MPQDASALNNAPSEEELVNHYERKIEGLLTLVSCSSVCRPSLFYPILLVLLFLRGSAQLRDLLSDLDCHRVESEPLQCSNHPKNVHLLEKLRVCSVKKEII